MCDDRPGTSRPRGIDVLHGRRPSAEDTRLTPITPSRASAVHRICVDRNAQIADSVRAAEALLRSDRRPVLKAVG
jgi:hypothetical protein